MVEDPSKWVFLDEKHDQAVHMEERMTNGFSVYDWWNFCDYMAWVNIQALERFKNGVGYPADLNSLDEWRAELDIMIDGFKAHLDIENMDYNWRDKEDTKRIFKVKDDGLALYAKRFSSLWD